MNVKGVELHSVRRKNLLNMKNTPSIESQVIAGNKVYLQKKYRKGYSLIYNSLYSQLEVIISAVVDTYYFFFVGISPFCIWSTNSCRCLSSKLSNCTSHSLHYCSNIHSLYIYRSCFCTSLFFYYVYKQNKAKLYSCPLKICGNSWLQQQCQKK